MIVKTNEGYSSPVCDCSECRTLRKKRAYQDNLQFAVDQLQAAKAELERENAELRKRVEKAKRDTERIDFLESICCLERSGIDKLKAWHDAEILRERPTW